jgi:uncharacterized membrane protein YgcG
MTNRKNSSKFRRHRGTPRRSFTMIEMIVAAVIVSFVLGSVSISLMQIGKARTTSRLRLQANLRAQAALEAIRRDIAGVMRSEDLFLTRVLLTDEVEYTSLGTMDRDDLLIFSDRVRPTRELEYNGEGMEYETQYRVVDDDLGPVLLQRRDPVPDRYWAGGGTVTPVGEGVVSLKIEAYDGQWWWDEWDSDELGLPWAMRVTVTTLGSDSGADAYAEPAMFATLRTIVAIDRTPVPPPPEEELTVDTDGDGVPDAPGENAGEEGATEDGAEAEGGASGSEGSSGDGHGGPGAEPGGHGGGPGGSGSGPGGGSGGRIKPGSGGTGGGPGGGGGGGHGMAGGSKGGFGGKKK